MKKEELYSALEAVLFSSGEPMSIDRISQIFELSPEKTEKALIELAEILKNNNRGIELLRLENAWQLATAKKHSAYIKKAFDIRRKTPLSPAALEVLAVIAYNQPVTKSFIEQVRGVDCSGVVSTLVEKELIEERGRLELPGRPLLYGTTKNFLRCFSITDLSELPPLPKSQPEVSDVAEQLEMDGSVTGLDVDTTDEKE
ncbi:MAG: SMC-Scp complex subunit ScpB [Ruminococcaceae bacterium]|nr:SMC-Scp complex subunit ScpB [Oscillospiraceae bacterium]